MSILIIEDNPQDIEFYTPILSDSTSIYFLCPITYQKLNSLVFPVYQRLLSHEIKKNKLKLLSDYSGNYEFYFLDGLSDMYNNIICSHGIPSNKTAIVTSDPSIFHKEKGLCTFDKEIFRDMDKDEIFKTIKDFYKNNDNRSYHVK